ncbi:transmembrane protein 145-like isoform X2 [Lycorma delicatula]|uniref:transmembrane protein 145-like isoform X2 n=1 Tax=Lycorma delicatula TaxID=130591 RepID=UPI003F517813
MALMIINFVLVLYKVIFTNGKFLQGELKSNEEYAPQNLLLYYDSENQWPAVYKTNKTCQQKEAVLNREQNQIILLTSADSSAGCLLVSNSSNSRSTSFKDTKIMSCHNSRRFRSARERWWFLAISNCNSTKGLSMQYKFLMTNGPPGDYWHEHFSADEFYILPVLLAFFLTYILLILGVIMCSMELKARQLLHSTYKLFAASVILQECGIFNQCIAYTRYAEDGVGLPISRDIGRFFESASEVLFLLLLLLLAKGYTVTRGRLKIGSTVKLTVFMCLYIIGYYSLFQYEREYFDPGEVLYTYESPAGYGLIALRIIAWWMFIYSTILTLKHYPEKASFYYPFDLIATLWFITGPAFIICANNFVDKWVRESIVCFVQHSIAIAGHILFLMLTLPNKANKNFPYHVRTTQIGVMEITDGSLGNNTLDHFCHHPYAPGGAPLRTQRQTTTSDWDVPIELFTVSNTVQDVDYYERINDGKLLTTSNTNNGVKGQNQEGGRGCLNFCPEEASMVPDFTAPSQRRKTVFTSN